MSEKTNINLKKLSQDFVSIKNHDINQLFIIDSKLINLNTINKKASNSSFVQIFNIKNNLNKFTILREIKEFPILKNLNVTISDIVPYFWLILLKENNINTKENIKKNEKLNLNNNFTINTDNIENRLKIAKEILRKELILNKKKTFKKILKDINNSDNDIIDKANKICKDEPLTYSADQILGLLFTINELLSYKI
jgi:hypothetical protein